MAKGTARLRWRVGRAGAAGEYRRRAGSPGRVLRSRAATQPLLVAGLVESPVPGGLARRVRRAVRGNGLVERRAPRPGPTLQRPPSPPCLAAGAATRAWRISCRRTG